MAILSLVETLRSELEINVIKLFSFFPSKIDTLIPGANTASENATKRHDRPLARRQRRRVFVFRHNWENMVIYFLPTKFH